MGRLWFRQVFHQCLVLAGLLHCGCKSNSFFFCVSEVVKKLLITFGSQFHHRDNKIMMNYNALNCNMKSIYSRQSLLCLQNYLCVAPNIVITVGCQSYYEYKWHELKYLLAYMTSKNITNAADKNTTKLELKIFQIHIGFMQSSGSIY